MHRLPPPLSALLLCMTVSCGGPEQSKTVEGALPSAGASVATGDPATGAAAATAATQRGEFVDGDQRSSWMLTAMPGGGVSIEDDARFGEDGQANRVFTFDASGTLLRATEQRTQTAPAAGNPSPAPTRTELIIDFTGTPPTATKMVDDVRRTVEPYEIDSIRRRGDALLQQARRSPPR